MNRIKELKEERNLGVRTLGQLVDINFMTLNHYENGDRDIGTNTLKKLALFFEVSTDYLLCHSSEFIYALYKNEDFYIRFNEHDYKALLSAGYISFVNNHRYFDFNKYCGVDDKIDLTLLIVESIRIHKFDLLFENDLDVDEIKGLSGDITDIDFNSIDVELIRKSLKISND